MRQPWIPPEWNSDASPVTQVDGKRVVGHSDAFRKWDRQLNGRSTHSRPPHVRFDDCSPAFLSVQFRCAKNHHCSVVEQDRARTSRSYRLAPHGRAVVRRGHPTRRQIDAIISAMLVVYCVPRQAGHPNLPINAHAISLSTRFLVFVCAPPDRRRGGSKSFLCRLTFRSRAKPMPLYAKQGTDSWTVLSSALRVGRPVPLAMRRVTPGMQGRALTRRLDAAPQCRRVRYRLDIHAPGRRSEDGQTLCFVIHVRLY
jgi:hypothetical protein